MFFCDVRGYIGCAVIALQGELDVSNTAEFSSRLAAVTSCELWSIVDLTELAYIDCSALGVLTGAREQARLAGGDVLLAGPCGAVARLLVLTGQAEVFSVFPSFGCAAFSAGLTAFGDRLARSSAKVDAGTGHPVAATLPGAATT